MSNEGGSCNTTVELITGRGKRSEGGKSRLKPAVVHRLKQRRLRYELYKFYFTIKIVIKLFMQIFFF